MQANEELSSVAISPRRLNGLKYTAKVESKRVGVRVSMTAYLDRILNEAGVPELTDKGLDSMLRKISK